MLPAQQLIYYSVLSIICESAVMCSEKRFGLTKWQVMLANISSISLL